MGCLSTVDFDYPFEAVVHPVVDGLAADFQVTGKFRFFHFGMEVGGVA